MQLAVGMPDPFPNAVVEARRRQLYGRNLGLDILREDADGDLSKRCEVAILAHLYRMHLHASLARRLRSQGGSVNVWCLRLQAYVGPAYT